MIDEAAIFTSVLRRNDWRIRNHFVPIVVSREYQFRLALARETELRDDLPELTARFTGDREIIQAQVIADTREQQGDAFLHTPAGHWTIVHETRKRFDRFLRDQIGMTDLPAFVPMNATIISESGVIEEQPISEAVIIDFAAFKRDRGS